MLIEKSLPAVTAMLHVKRRNQLSINNFVVDVKLIIIN